jgi:hypothetical protein
MFDNHTINIDYVLCMIPSAYGKTAHTFEGATVGPDHQIKKLSFNQVHKNLKPSVLVYFT